MKVNVWVASFGARILPLRPSGASYHRDPVLGALRPVDLVYVYRVRFTYSHQASRATWRGLGRQDKWDPSK